MTTDNKIPVSSADARKARGLALVQKVGKRIKHITGESYFVPSSAGGSTGYVVDLAASTCTCADAETCEGRCKHQWAVLILRRDVIVDGDPTPEEKRPTYRQKSWPNYHRAQCEEKERVQVLLRGLCDGIVQPPAKPTGRPSLLLSDVIYAATLKVFGTMSGRRSTTDIRACERAGFIESAPNYNSIFRYMENPTLTPLLTAMVEESARPLVAIEENFAADATGFATSVYARWFDHKYGSEKRVQQWVKAHAMVGVATHVITSVTVTGAHDNDCPQFTTLLDATRAAGFNPKEISGDKAYLSAENLAAVEAIGAVPFIPMKTNSVSSTTHTEAWQRLYRYFFVEREEFLQHYHRRSNVESAFSSMKRKFGASVRSKTPTAQVNEVLLKCLAHNLSMTGHAIGEFGVDPKFWTPRPPMPPLVPVAPVASEAAA